MDMAMLNKLWKEKSEEQARVYKETRVTLKGLNLLTAKYFKNYLEEMESGLEEFDIMIEVYDILVNIILIDNEKKYTIKIFFHDREKNIPQLKVTYLNSAIIYPNSILTDYFRLLSFILEDIHTEGDIILILENSIKNFMTITNPLTEIQKDVSLLMDEIEVKINGFQEENFHKNCVEGAVLVYNARYGCKVVTHGFKIKKLLPKTIVYDTVAYDPDTMKLTVNENEDNRMKIDRFKKDYVFTDDYFWREMKEEIK